MKNDAKSHQKILARDWDCPTSGGGHANQSGRRCKRRLWQLCCFGSNSGLSAGVYQESPEIVRLDLTRF